MPSPPQAIEPLESRRHLSAGDLDPSFGTGGTITLRNGTMPATGTPDTQTTHLTLDHAGRTLVVSSSYTAAPGVGVEQPAASVLTRLTPDGHPDPRFAVPTGGSIVLNPDQPPRKILVDSQDRIYVVSEDFVRRYTASGKIDRTYGNGGTAEADAYFDDTTDATMGNDDTLWLVGTTYDDEGPGGPYTYVARFAPDGRSGRAAETPFDPNGSVTPGDSYDFGMGTGLLRTLPDGSVLAVVDAYTSVRPADGGAAVSAVNVLAFKFKPNGRIDRTYGKNGRVSYRRIDPVDDNIEDDAQVSLVGIYDDGTVLIRDTPGGGTARHVTLTPAGRQGGVVPFGRTTYDYVTDFALHTQPDGRRLVFDGVDHTVRRYNADGMRDSTFNHGSPLKGVTAVAFGPDDTLLTADIGRSATDSRFVVRRIEL